MKIYLLTLFITICNCLFAQQSKIVRDIGMWTGLEVEYKFKEDFAFSVLQDIRLYESFTKLERAVSELGFSYDISKNFKLNSNARFSLKHRDDNSYSKDLRYNFDLSFKIKVVKNLKLKYRLRFQQGFENALSLNRSKVGNSRANLRNKLEVNYSIKTHTLYWSFELFRELVVYRKPNFNKFRMQLGNEWDNKLGKFDFAIAYERELNDNHPLNFVFAKLYYTFKFENE